MTGGKWAILPLNLETDRWYHIVLFQSRSRLNLEQKAPANVSGDLPGQAQKSVF